MKNLLIELHWDARRELDKIHKGELKLSERLALEKAIVKLEDLRKVFDYVNIIPKP